VTGLQLMDVTPTVLKFFGVTPPADLQGHLIDAAIR